MQPTPPKEWQDKPLFDLATIRPNERNPRTISAEALAQLKISVGDFWKMLALRPIVYDSSTGRILGGTQRYRALCELGYSQIPTEWVKDCAHLTEEEKRRFILTDNTQSGEWDLEILQADYTLVEIDSWGLEIEQLTEFVEVEIHQPQNDAPRDYQTPDRAGSLARRFGVPPFSILDTRQGYWQERKQTWRTIINDNGESREGTLRQDAAINDPAFYRKKESKEKELGRELTKKEFETEHYEPPNSYITSGVSLLDPVLAEILCQWFGRTNGKYFDCFAGDTVFGYVAAHIGNEFIGIELRDEQARLNNERVQQFGELARYICDDGRNVQKHIPKNSQDFLFSCPPYFDLEVYSDLPNDASNQATYADFIAILKTAFVAACECLKENSFAAIVVGDVRDTKGAYYGFPDSIKQIFSQAGLHLYNELILVEVSGNASIRAAQQMKGRKVVKTHQNVLIFYKGDPSQIRQHYPEIEPHLLTNENDLDDESADAQF